MRITVDTVQVENRPSQFRQFGYPLQQFLLWNLLNLFIRRFRSIIL